MIPGTDQKWPGRGSEIPGLGGKPPGRRLETPRTKVETPSIVCMRPGLDVVIPGQAPCLLDRIKVLLCKPRHMDRDLNPWPEMKGQAGILTCLCKLVNPGQG